MTKTKLLLGSVIAFAFTILLVTPNVYAQTFDPTDKKSQKNIWDVIYDIESRLGIIEQKITTTVNGVQTSTTTPPPIHLPHHKHHETKNTIYNPSNPDVYYTSLSTGGDVPIDPVLDLSQIPPQCNSVNIGTVANPDYEVLGWCPDSGETYYFMQDSRVTANSLITLNIQNTPTSLAISPDTPPPVCQATTTGTFQFATQNMTGFVLECDPNKNLPVTGQSLVYIVLN